MELEKLYYNPSHYAGYLAMDNLPRAAENFSRNEIVRWLESQDAYTLHRRLAKISTIALQRDECRRCMGSGFDRASGISKVTTTVILIYW